MKLLCKYAPALLFLDIASEPKSKVVANFSFRMIESDKDANAETRKVHIDNLFRVVQYCENKIDCRRAQQIHYFGERDFDSTQCKENPATVCDNCMVNEQVSSRWIDCLYCYIATQLLVFFLKRDVILVSKAKIFDNRRQKCIYMLISHWFSM